MGNSSIVENHSLIYSDTVITANTTLTVWNRTFYTVNATAGNITITLPNTPKSSNTVERGTLVFQRTDATANVVQISGEINGLSQLITIPTGNDSHWFTSILSSTNGFFSVIYQKTSGNTFVRITGDVMQGAIDSSSYNIRVLNPTDVTNTSKDVVNVGYLISKLPATDGLNVFLASTGLDTNLGTVIAPFLTLTKAETIITTGGTVWIQSGGTYTDALSLTVSNVAWNCPANLNSTKTTLTGLTTIAGSTARRSFKGINFSTGGGPCISHTSTQGILNFENCAFTSSNTNGISAGGSITSNAFSYLNNCDFTAMTGNLRLANNTTFQSNVTYTTGSSTVTLVSGTLTVGSYITSSAIPPGTKVASFTGGAVYVLSAPALSTGSSTTYTAIVWYISNCTGLKLNIGNGHLVVGFNNPSVTLSGNTDYVESNNAIATVVTTQANMLAQTSANFGGIGYFTKVTSDATVSNNGLWQCIGNTFSSLSNWLQLSNVYAAGTGLTLSNGTFSITPQTASRAVITDGSGNLSTSTVTSATLAFLDATSSVQTQINSLVPIVQNQKTVKAATTAIISLSGLQTIDGIALVAGDEMLQCQTTAIVNNGIWVVAAGAWTRSTQMPTGSDAAKAKIFVLQGTQNAGTIWTCTSATGSIVGTASLAIPQFMPAASIVFTTLTAAITNAVTTLPVTSTNGFPATGVVIILNEAILYTGKTSNSFTGCTRGYNGTTAVAAVINAYVNFSTEEIPYYKMGADFTTSTIPTRVFRDKMWFSGTAAGVRTWTPSQIPWVYTDITAAELACIYWVQELMTFFKGLENDNNWDQVIGAIAASITPRITGNLQTPDGGTDMDNAVILGAAASQLYASEWFELIVGRNPAGTELYTMSFTVASVSTATPTTNIDMLYPFRIIWQTTRGAAMAGFNGQAAVASSASVPKCTQYTTAGVTIPAAGFPIWAVPVSIETTF